MVPEDQHVFKFALLPKTREEWLRAFLFLFQAYVVLAFVVRSFYYYKLPHGKGALVAFYNFEERIQIGYAICLVVLSYSGIADLIMGRWRSGRLNLCLAAFSVWMLFRTRSWAIS
jgi:hypothetical protein